MPFENGRFIRVMNWVKDAANKVLIFANRHDDEDDNFAAGIDACLRRDSARDGGKPTNNFDFNNFKGVNLKDATALKDAVNLGQLIVGVNFFIDQSATANKIIIDTPQEVTYLKNGQSFVVKVANQNTNSAVTMKVDGGDEVPIVDNIGSPLQANDLKVYGLYEFRYLLDENSENGKFAVMQALPHYYASFVNNDLTNLFAISNCILKNPASPVFDGSTLTIKAGLMICCPNGGESSRVGRNVIYKVEKNIVQTNSPARNNKTQYIALSSAGALYFADEYYIQTSTPSKTSTTAAGLYYNINNHVLYYSAADAAVNSWTAIVAAVISIVVGNGSVITSISTYPVVQLIDANYFNKKWSELLLERVTSQNGTEAKTSLELVSYPSNSLYHPKTQTISSVRTVTAGARTIGDLLALLVSSSHSHTITTIQHNCDCTCDDSAG